MIRRFFGLNADEERSLSFQDVWGTGLDITSYRRTASGKPVTQESALEVSAVYGSVRIISDGLSTLPVDSFIRQDGVRRPFRPKPQWLYFEQGPFRKTAVMSQITTSLLLDGNAFVGTHRDATSKIQRLEPLDPRQVEVYHDDSTGLPYYVVNGARFSPLDILHIPGMMLPGEKRGVSPITAARETIGLAAAATEYGATFFGNGALPGMTAEVPGQLTPEGIKQLKLAWEEAHGGSGNAHRLAVLTEGAKFNKVTVAPDDAQFLQTREFQVADIARIYGVPPHLLADASGSTSWGSGLQEQNTAYVQHTLRPWVERVEEAFSWLMFTESLPPNAFVKLNVDGLLRGDHQRRMSAYTQGLNYGIYSINEIRAWEDMPPIEGGDAHLAPLNLANIAAMGEEATGAEQARDLVTMVQKVYLGVGTVLTADEAREILNRAGANLGDFSPPTPEPPAATDDSEEEPS